MSIFFTMKNRRGTLGNKIGFPSRYGFRRVPEPEPDAPNLPYLTVKNVRFRAASFFTSQASRRPRAHSTRANKSFECGRLQTISMVANNATGAREHALRRYLTRRSYERDQRGQGHQRKVLAPPRSSSPDSSSMSSRRSVSIAADVAMITGIDANARSTYLKCG